MESKASTTKAISTITTPKPKTDGNKFLSSLSSYERRYAFSTNLKSFLGKHPQFLSKTEIRLGYEPLFFLLTVRKSEYAVDLLIFYHAEREFPGKTANHAAEQIEFQQAILPDQLDGNFLRSFPLAEVQAVVEGACFSHDQVL